MVLVSTTMFQFIAWLEFVIHIPNSITIVYRYMQFKKHGTKKDTKLNLLWYLFMLFILNLCFTAFLFSTKPLLPKGSFRKFVTNTRYILGQGWFFIFTAIQITLILIIRETHFRSTKAKDKRNKAIHYLYLIPVILFLFNIPTYANVKGSSDQLEYDTQILSNVGAFLCGMLSFACCFWLLKEFDDLKKIVDGHQYAAHKNETNNRIWRTFLYANLFVGFLLGCFTIVDNIDDVFVFRWLNQDVVGDIPDGMRNYCKARLLNTLIKLIYALVILFLSPQVKMKVKKINLEVEPKAGMAKGNNEHSVDYKGF